MKEASVDDIIAAGMPSNTAELIYEKLQEKEEA